MATKADLRSMILKHDPDADVKNLKHSELVALLNKVDDTPAAPVEMPQEAKPTNTPEWSQDSARGSIRVKVIVEVEGDGYTLRAESHNGRAAGRIARRGVDNKERIEKLIHGIANNRAAAAGRDLEISIVPWTDRIIP